MMTIRCGIFAAHEQYSPNQLLEHAVLAEKYGMDSIWSSDHFHPWAHSNAQAGFAWIWIAAAAERTKKIHIGTGVTAPILRYNPAIVAQAFATLDHMYPGRIFLGLGTGEAMNETPIGYTWPRHKERAERLEEAIKIIQMLWQKDWCNFKGKYYRLKNANLYTKPTGKIPIYVASSGAKVAELAGKYADGFLTIQQPREKFREVLFPAIERGAKATGRDPSSIEKVIELLGAYDEDFDKAVESCRFWGGVMLPVFFDANIADPRIVEYHAQFVGREAFAKNWLVVTSPDEAIKGIEEYLKLGFRHVQILSSSPDQKKFIRVFGEKVFPYLKETYKDV